MNSSLASISLFLGTAVAVLALSTPPISVKSVPVKAVFFDCDDCLYFDNWHVANRLTVAIEKYCTEKLILPQGKAYALYKEHGTALLGLLNEGLITNKDVDDYLGIVHDIQVNEHLKRDPSLRALLLRIDPSIKIYIFTASVRHHAEECLKALGISDIFGDRIIDTKVCKLATKHSKSSFRAAMDFAKIPIEDAGQCVFFDDSVKNIATANRFGWRPVLVGLKNRDSGAPVICDDAEARISTIHSLFKAIPELERK